MNTVNLQISMPEELFNLLSLNNKGKSMSEIISENIYPKIEIHNSVFEQLMIEGYLASNSDDSEINSDFIFSDLEYLD